MLLICCPVERKFVQKVPRHVNENVTVKFICIKNKSNQSIFVSLGFILFFPISVRHLAK